MGLERMNWVSYGIIIISTVFHLVFLAAPLRIAQPHGNLKNVPSAPNLEVLNPLYDLTPPTFITAVVTEVGLIPPSSISSIPLALGKTSL